MKYSILIILVFLTVISQSCSEDCCDDKPGPVLFSVVNSEGFDLLNSENDGAYDFDDIKLYYLKKGERVEVYHGNYDHPRNLSLSKTDSISWINVFVDTSSKKTTNLIEWNKTDTDTLVCSISNNRISRVWFNGTLKYEYSVVNDIPYFQVVK